MKKNIINKIKENRKKISEKGVIKIGLFGSFLKNKSTKKSDVDIIVKFDNVNFDKYIELKMLLEKIFRREVDLVIEEDLREELSYIKKEVEYVEI